MFNFKELVKQQCRSICPDFFWEWGGVGDWEEWYCSHFPMPVGDTVGKITAKIG